MSAGWLHGIQNDGQVDGRTWNGRFQIFVKCKEEVIYVRRVLCVPCVVLCCVGSLFMDLFNWFVAHTILLHPYTDTSIHVWIHLAHCLPVHLRMSIHCFATHARTHVRNTSQGREGPLIRVLSWVGACDYALSQVHQFT